MAGVQSVWGIDIGRCALKAIKLRPAQDDKIEVVGFDYIEHARILSQPDADRHALIAAALEKFLSRNDISKDHVVIGVPGQHTLARFTKLPPVAPKRIPDIVRYEADQQIPFDMDEVIWDYQTFQQEGLPDVEVGIFAMKRELIREHLLHFEQASIEPIAVQSGPLAVYNAAHFDGLLGKETTVLLDIGAENTDLVVATPSSFWTRTVPIGGNAFTEALVKSFKLSFSKAEALKRTAATSKYARQIFQAMRPIFADLVQELQRSIGFYSSTHRDANVDKVVAFGNALLLPGLQKYLQQNLGIPVEKPESLRNAARSDVLKDNAFKEQFSSFAVSYGLALQGLDLTKVTSNLLPTEIAKQVVWRKKRPAFAAAAACLLLAGGLIWVRQSADASALAAGAAGAESASIRDESQAIATINNGPSPGLADRARGKAVVEAANVLKRALSGLAGQGTTERTETERLIDLQQNKIIVPALLHVIHSSVPREHDPLGHAEASGNRPALAGLPPRDQRNFVTIESLDMVYEPDLRLFRWESRIEVPPPINNHDPNVGNPLPGLLVKIVCSTPNSGGAAYIRDSFINALRENGRKPGAGFYIDQLILYEGYRWEPEVDTFSRTGFAGGRTAPRPGGPAGADALKTDVITNELRDTDWRFEIWADVVLEDLPPDVADDDETDDESADEP